MRGKNLVDDDGLRRNAKTSRQFLLEFARFVDRHFLGQRDQHRGGTCGVAKQCLHGARIAG